MTIRHILAIKIGGKNLALRIIFNLGKFFEKYSRATWRVGYFSGCIVSETMCDYTEAVWTVGYLKDLLATPFFAGILVVTQYTNLPQQYRRRITGIFSCALAVDLIFSCNPALHHESVTDAWHWGVGVLALAGAGMGTALFIK